VYRVTVTRAISTSAARGRGELGEGPAIRIAVEAWHSHGERDDRGESDQAERDVGRVAIDRPGTAQKKREAEYEQEVARDRSNERGPDDRGQTLGDGDDRNDQLRRVAERRVQEAADNGADVNREVVRHLADQPRERDERHGRQYEHRHVAGSVEPVQGDDERRQQQQRGQ
jgi:hypothetical protein